MYQNMPLLTSETLQSYINNAKIHERTSRFKFVRIEKEIWLDNEVLQHVRIWRDTKNETYPSDAGWIAFKPSRGEIIVSASSLSLDRGEDEDERLETISILQGLVRLLADENFQIVNDTQANLFK
jgi:hypothetical protein